MRADRARAPLSAVFLDRDGVINRKAPEGRYVESWEEFEFLPKALEGLALLGRSDAALVVVTNQRGIARGKMTSADLSEIHRRMSDAIEAAGGRLDAIYHCPHDVGCACRKPEVGMFQAAAADLGLRLSESAVIGDQPSDMLAAQRIGALRVRIEAGTDRRADPASPPGEDADHVARDLADASRWLVDRGYVRVARSLPRP